MRGPPCVVRTHQSNFDEPRAMCSRIVITAQTTTSLPCAALNGIESVTAHLRAGFLRQGIPIVRRRTEVRADEYGLGGQAFARSAAPLCRSRIPWL